MRKILGMILVLASASAMAQTSAVAKINEGYASLRTYPTVNLHIDMVDLYGQTLTPSTLDLTWGWDPSGKDGNAYLKGAEAVDGKELTETVADGSTLFNFDVIDHDSVSHEYGNAPIGSPYRMDLLQRLYSLSGRRGCYAARALEEIFGGDAPAYAPWSTGEMTMVDANSDPFQDPLTDEIYTPSPTREFIAFETTGHVSRSIVFQRDQITLDDNSTQWIISAIYVSKYDDTNPKLPNGFELAIEIDPVDSVPDPQEFTFTPPSRTEEGRALPG